MRSRNTGLKMMLLGTVALTGILLHHSSFAAEIQGEIKLTEDYQKWLTLSEEERKNLMQPLPYSVSISKSGETTENPGLRSNISLRELFDAKFNLSDQITIPVKDQQNTGECWAFSLTSVLEANIAKTSGQDSARYSERHMDYATSRTFLDNKINEKGFSREVGEGGNPGVGLAYYVRGDGPILESNMPFENNEDKIDISEIQGKKVQKKIENYQEFPGIYKTKLGEETIYSDGIGTVYTEEQVNHTRNTIKNHLIHYGAVTAANYSSGKQYYSNTQDVTSSKAYYCDDPQAIPDHAITIVGWDDNYAVTNFNEQHRPNKPGAYIVLNSWGQDVFNQGYFYVSYEDVNIEKSNFGIVQTDQIDYDHIYQHDMFGSTYGFSPINATNRQPITTLYGANVFTRDPLNPEALKEVSFNLTEPAIVEIAINQKSGEITGENVKTVKTTETLQPGYHTIELDSPVQLKGEKFAIILKYHTNEQRLGIGTEMNYKANGISNTYYDTVVAQKGESYVSVDGQTWNDFTEIMKESNLCIKAFTIDREEIKIKEITLDKQEIKMKPGQTETIQITLNPVDTTEEVIWSSSDEKVVTVKDGVITGVGEGTATVTVSSPDGTVVAKCTITVKAQDSNPSDNTVNTNSIPGTKDNTTSPIKLPAAGMVGVTIFIIGFMGIGIYGYIRYKNYKEI